MKIRSFIPIMFSALVMTIAVDARADVQNETIDCSYEGQDQLCSVITSFSQAGTSVEITFEDANFTRKMTYDNGTFRANGVQGMTTTQDENFYYVTNDNNEYFALPKLWFE